MYVLVDMSVECLSEEPNLNKSSFFTRSLTVTDLKRQQRDADTRDRGGVPAYSLKNQDVLRRNAKRKSRNSTTYLLCLETDIMEHRVPLEPFRCKILAG